MARTQIALALILLIAAAGCPKKEDAVDGEKTPAPDVTVEATATPAETAEPVDTPITTDMQDAGGVLVVGAEKAWQISVGDDGKWQVEEQLDIPGVAVRADADDTSLYIVTSTEVRGYDNQFNQITKTVRFEAKEGVDPTVPPAVPPFQRTASLDVSDGEAFVSEAKAFQVVSPGNVVSTTLNLPKTAHDVLVHGDSAYLIDDIMRPLWVHRVDLSDSRRPRMATSHEMRLVNGHLGVHWIDVDAGKWYISSSQSHRGGSDLSIKVLPLATTKESEAASIVLWQKSRHGGGESGGPWPEGTAIWRVTGSPPWGLMKQGTTMFVGRIGNESDPVALSRRWTAPAQAGDRTATGLALNGNTLHVAIGRNLYVLDVAGGQDPALLATIPLPAEPVDILSW